MQGQFRRQPFQDIRIKIIKKREIQSAFDLFNEEYLPFFAIEDLYDHQEQQGIIYRNLLHPKGIT